MILDFLKIGFFVPLSPMKINKYLIVCLIAILLDQISKMAVYTYMDYGVAGELKWFGWDWARLHYIHNPGMAFGITIAGDYGKLILSVFRIIAISGLGYFFYLQIKEKAHPGFLFCLALILGGAIGNGIDSVFYGVLIDNAIPNAPTPWFHGQVIDMLYFPMFEGTFPEWFPFKGGQRFLFFSAIFNLADSFIFIGAVTILVFNKKFFPPEDMEPKNKKPDAIDGFIAPDTEEKESILEEE